MVASLILSISLVVDFQSRLPESGLPAEHFGLYFLALIIYQLMKPLKLVIEMEPSFKMSSHIKKPSHFCKGL